MKDEIKEITKVDKELLDKIEHILGDELSSKEYNVFYNYFNEIRKPNILIDIKDVDSVKDYITNLQEGNHNLLQEIEDMQNKNNKLIERNEKAIEYIKEHITIDAEYPGYMEMLVEEKDELLNILQGEDKDE